jgi:heptosyltransferase-1
MPPRPPLYELHADRVLIIKPSALGDVINGLPVLGAVRRRFPRAHVAWLVNRCYEPLLTGHPDLDETIAFDRRAGLLRGGAELARRLLRAPFDLALDLQGLFRSGVMSWLSGARRRVGLAGAREGASWFYTDTVPAPGPRTGHAVDRCWAMAVALGVGAAPIAFRLPVAPAAAARADELLRDLPRPRVILAVGSRWPTKRWPPGHFAALAARAQAAFGGSAVFVGSPDERALADEVRAGLPGPSLNLSGRTSMTELVGLLARADVVVANDTGPLHLAVALGRPVVAPYTCTRVALNGPYGQAGRAVETTVWCAGSYRKKCARLECMAELTPERLWGPLEGVLSEWRRSCA